MRNIIGGLPTRLVSKAAGTAFAAAMLCTAFASEAQATVSVTVWNFSTGGTTIGDPSQQALPTNPQAGGTPTATFDFNGPIDWDVTPQSSNFLDLFVTGGTISSCVGVGCASSTSLGHVLISTSGFDVTSLFRISFTLAAPASGIIDHDDGVSIFDSTDTTLFYDASAPTVEVPLAVALGAGSYNLWYVEANGAPSVLDISPNVINRTSTETPEPGTLVLIAMSILSMVGFGFLRQRKAL